MLGIRSRCFLRLVSKENLYHTGGVRVAEKDSQQWEGWKHSLFGLVTVVVTLFCGVNSRMVESNVRPDL